ncbi:phosphoenolpyruvate carboxykinase (ATP) [Chloroflexota bacterium]
MVINSSDNYLGLNSYGIKNVGSIYRNLSTPALYEETVKRSEGHIAHLGPIVVRTGHYTGRSPEDKFIVKEESSQDKIWWGKSNKPFEVVKFDYLYHRLLAYLQGKDIFIQDCYAGADPQYRRNVRIITEYAWHNLFARNMFIQIQDEKELEAFKSEFTIFGLPRFHATPEIDGTHSDAFVIVNFGKKLIIIGGTGYAGEMKKAVFTVLNYLLPQEEVLSMHCAANIGLEGDVALFFGLSGTGKTTLSTDDKRSLIGDDEHGWSDRGVFNFEGGCYAKVIRISGEQEPQIYDCTRKFGTILENVTVDVKSRRIDLDDSVFTENTRASYPIAHIEGSVRSGIGDHPQNIFMLSCDAFGVMPPIAMLSPEQAAYYYLQGYTAKVAGTEIGISEPQVVFSPCFGSPFLALPPIKYANLLLDKIIKHKANCWMVNTGWVRGGFDKGERISLPYTRALIREAIAGNLAKNKMDKDPIFNFMVPASCKEVPSEILNPANVWESQEEYYKQAKIIARKFLDNFEQFSGEVSPEVMASGPKL